LLPYRHHTAIQQKQKHIIVQTVTTLQNVTQAVLQQTAMSQLSANPHTHTYPCIHMCILNSHSRSFLKKLIWFMGYWNSYTSLKYCHEK
jgi:hypothetical protein